ncbi:MAG: DUF3795 domain-containing protein [Syntrophaceae bacterium]|nr:DUF3795 domain-containing protein [Syntrophaceae bacterium]
MNNQSRRSFCQLCLMAGASIGSGISIATALPSKSLAEALSEENKKTKGSDRKIDYGKVGYCGYRCDICPGRSEDRNVRRKMVDGWIKLFGHSSYTDENIPVAKSCAGCKSSGEVADLQCQARSCAREKGLILCADCDQFPCQKLRPLLSDRHQLLMYLKGKDVTLEEYTMSAMQFESMPVLLLRMVEIGKLPAWVKDLV